MAVTIGSNVAALGAQRQLGRSASAVEVNYERLSSGQRINRASDDAAGLSVASSLSSDARVLAQARRNVSDGVSLLTVVTEALSAQQSILQRMKELAAQSANGVLADSQRASLHTEYSALVQEYQRVAETTQFNGIRPLQRGDSTSISLQVGITGAAASLISIDALDRASTGGVVGVRLDLNGSGSVTGFDATVEASWSTRAGVYAGLPPPTLDDIVSFLGDAVSHTKLTDSLGRGRDVFVVLIPQNQYAAGLFDQTLVRIFADLGQGGLSSLGQFGTYAFGSVNSAAVTFSDTGATGSVTVDLSDISYQRSDVTEVTPTSLRFSGTESQQRALSALKTVEAQLVATSGVQGMYGALQSRLASASESIITAREAYLGAAARITDVDVAAEAGDLVRNRMLQDIGAAVLAQANVLPSLAIKLLAN